ncbi:MAG: hypothetical protein KH296_05355 [Ruminococcus sp.]|nr:hypothetical protein [Ruminococcus sp.]
MNENKEKINECLNNYLDFDLFMKDGNLNYEKLIEKGVEITRGQRADVVFSESESGEEITFEWNGEVINVKVPRRVQQKIRFAVEYVFSEFDKINDNINSLARDLNNQIISTVEASKNTLENIRKKDVDEIDEIDRQMLVNTLQPLKTTIYNLKKKLEDIIKEINDIPQKRWVRVLKTNIKKELNQEKIAHLDMGMYIEGVGVYVEMTQMLGKNEWALDVLEDAKKFLNRFSKEELSRIEGWNEQKDGFWDEKVMQIFQSLNHKYEIYKKYSGKVIIEGGL